MKKIYPYYAFGKGYKELRDVDQPRVKSEIMSLLEITTDQAFGLYRRGERKLEAIIKDAIELTFAKYGVIKPWGFEADAESFISKTS